MMGSRGWIAILGIGIGSVVILGLLTKVAVESSPELQAIIRFKSALAEELAPSGVEEVSLRRSRERRGLVLGLTFASAAASAQPAGFEQTIAELLISRFEGDAGSALEIQYQVASWWGCDGPAAQRQSLVPLAPVRVRVADHKAADKLATRLQATRWARWGGFTRGDRDIAVEVKAAEGFTGDPRALAFEVEPEVRAAFGGSIYPSLRLRVAAPGQTCEVRFDRAGRELDASGKPTGRRADGSSTPAGAGRDGAGARSPSRPGSGASPGGVPAPAPPPGAVAPAGSKRAGER